VQNSQNHAGGHLGPARLEASRRAGEKRLEAFTPRMGRHYANGRNVDRGPDGHQDVSMLSPYLRRRLVLERDAVAAALRAHGREGADKFVQEVLWRGYFKGWLEHRPTLWDAYRDGLIDDLAMLDKDGRLRSNLARAEAGETGLACFDAWVRELVETGYLHNHARMWFASIWIFTLKLPWRLGADFFYRFLLDGDPASNTLSWRWVAGLHTRGKPYEARAWNIAKFTNGRFTPRETDLAQEIGGLEHLEPEGLPESQPLRAVSPPDPSVPAVLLITEEDCRVEDFGLEALDIRGTATLESSHLRSPREGSSDVAAFEAMALADTADRIGLTATPMRAGVPEDLARWAEGAGARQIVTPYVPVGPVRDALEAAAPALKAVGVTLAEWRREWDDSIWPHATAGFFKVKKQMPRILQEAGLL